MASQSEKDLSCPVCHDIYRDPVILSCSHRWLVLSKCRQYHFVNKSFTWHEAHSYCRKNYVGLASIGNSTEMNQLIKTVSSAGYNSEVWIGVYFDIYGYHAPEINDNFWNWENKTEPFLVYYFCGRLTIDGWRWYNNCSEEHPFICYNGEKI
uniref:C-type lectin domain-containing protein n=1 Tax=Neolamprologus brichardi TaxID=32507 RepID=A0A3Q4GCK6_NEOBR